MAGIADIARLAGTSTATVSRVLNRSGYVAPETRARVEAAVAALDYTPDAGAQAMRRGASRMVGVILPALDVPFFGILAQTIDRALAARGYQALILCTAESPEQEARAVSSLLAQKVAGVIAASVLADARQFARIAQTGAPVVGLDRALPLAGAQTVSVDHVAGGRMMADHLLALGHRRIAVVGAPGHSQPIRDRVAGIVAVLQAAGLPAPDTHLGPAHDFDACRQLARAALGAALPPTALAATTDTAAIGAIHAALDRGLAVPGDVSVIGFDDLPAARYVVPALTTVAQPLRALAEHAVAVLAARIAQETPPEPAPGQLALRLVLRASTAAPAAGPAP